MKAESIYRAALAETEKYRKLLHEVSEEEFQRTPAENVWSYAEVFSHVLQANLGSLYAIEKCLQRSATPVTRPARLLSRMILAAGRFPPLIRLKAPAGIAAMVKKINREEALQMMEKFLSRLDDIHPRIGAADPGYAYDHPRLGLLNAMQWYRFIQIHTRHHEKQLQRIKRMLYIL